MYRWTKVAASVLLWFSIFLMQCSALADQPIIMEPSVNDLSAQQAYDSAIHFFMRKCGISESSLRAGKWTSEFGYIFSGVPGTEHPHWVLSVREIENHTNKYHVIVLGAQGELLYWEAHSSGYTTTDPEIFDYATIIEPSDHDAGYSEVEHQVKQTLIDMEIQIPDEINNVMLDCRFAYDEHFNLGYTPVWLVNITTSDNERWKAVLDYHGNVMSLVPYYQDFTCYTMQNEDFWAATFSGEQYIEELELTAKILEGNISIEDRAYHTARWRPYVQEWLKEPPYLPNQHTVEYYLTIENVFGVPDELAIPQEDAVQIALDKAVQLGCESTTAEEARLCVVNYFITNPEQPVWSVMIVDITGQYEVRIDAHTGEVLEISMVE